MAELVLSPQWGFTQNNRASHRRIELGDHYTFDSAVSDGYREEWTLTAKGLSEMSMSSYVNFLENCAGVTPFEWRPNSSVTLKSFWCDSFNVVEEAPDLWSITLTIKEAR